MTARRLALAGPAGDEHVGVGERAAVQLERVVEPAGPAAGDVHAEVRAAPRRARSGVPRIQRRQVGRRPSMPGQHAGRALRRRQTDHRLLRVATVRPSGSAATQPAPWRPSSGRSCTPAWPADCSKSAAGVVELVERARRDVTRARSRRARRSRRPARARVVRPPRGRRRSLARTRKPALGLGRLGRLQSHRRLVDRLGPPATARSARTRRSPSACTRRRAAAGPSTPPAPPSAASPRPTTTGAPPDRHARAPTPRRQPSARGRRPSRRAPPASVEPARVAGPRRTVSSAVGRRWSARPGSAARRHASPARLEPHGEQPQLLDEQLQPAGHRVDRPGPARRHRGQVDRQRHQRVVGDRARRGVGDELARSRPQPSARAPPYVDSSARSGGLDRRRGRPLLPHDAAHRRLAPGRTPPSASPHSADPGVLRLGRGQRELAVAGHTQHRRQQTGGRVVHDADAGQPARRRHPSRRRRRAAAARAIAGGSVVRRTRSPSAEQRDRPEPATLRAGRRSHDTFSGISSCSGQPPTRLKRDHRGHAAPAAAPTGTGAAGSRRTTGRTPTPRTTTCEVGIEPNSPARTSGENR